MAFDFLRGNAKQMGLDRDFGSYDMNIQVMSPMHGKDTADLGVAFFVAILSAVFGRSISPGLVVLGQMSIHGVLNRVERLSDHLRVAMDSGAKRIVIPNQNAADLGTVPSELLDMISVDFFSKPEQAAFKSIVEV
jgi:ATP-dependent Lon protease